MHKKLNRKASKEFRIERKSIRNWIHNLLKLIATENKPKMITVNSGKRQKQTALKQKLLNGS